ncbi:hypothetical protein IL306_011605, partial [Fusarium sp. DS 682]
IEKLDVSIGNPVTMMSKPEKSLADCYSLLQVAQEEYAEYAVSLKARLYYDAFQISIAHGDISRARVFAERAYDARVICEGEDSPATMRMKSFVVDPRKHTTFGAYSMKWKTKKEGGVTGSNEAEFEKWLFRQ